MRSASLPGAAWRRACRCRESLSPGKVKEPGRLAGEAGTELQKEPPFCRGLLGGKGSLPNGEGDAAAAARGECRGEVQVCREGLGKERKSQKSSKTRQVGTLRTQFTEEVILKDRP